MSQQLCSHRPLDSSTPLPHTPLTFPAHSLCYHERSMCSGHEEDDPAPVRRQDSQTAAPPGSLHAIAACESALAHRSGTETHRRQRSGRRRPHPARRITLSALFRSAPCPHVGAMAVQRAVYRTRDAEHTVLHQVIAEHLEVFLRTVAAAGDGAGLPQFVEREFQEFLACGVFEHGVARFQCEGCAREQLVPFSRKGRAWCPSCGGRRMTERAAHQRPRHGRTSGERPQDAPGGGLEVLEGLEHGARRVECLGLRPSIWTPFERSALNDASGPPATR